MDSAALMVGDLKSRTRLFYSRRCSRRVRPKNTSIESLPNELLSDILLRLPADYLFDTARLVSRRWCHIIRSREFVHTQVQHSAYGFLYCNSSITTNRPFFFTATQGQIGIRQFSHICWMRYFSSCNGLAMQLHWNSRSPLIVNPATHETLALPSYPPHLFDYFYRCGLGYAVVYKVTVPHHGCCLSILTVGVDNSWREVPVEHLPIYARNLFDCHPLVTEGFIHYAGSTDEHVGQSKHAVTLDVETEILTVSEVPLANTGKMRYYLSTGRFLSMLVVRDDFSWEVWGMESRNGEWSKVLPDIDLGDHRSRLIEQFARGENKVLQPLGWVNYPEVLALRFCGGSRTCIPYNLDTHEINSTEQFACGENDGVVDVLMHFLSCKDLVFLILQFCDEENLKKTAHALEQKTGYFFDLKHFEELGLNGSWDEAEKYLSNFTARVFYGSRHS